MICESTTQPLYGNLSSVLQLIPSQSRAYHARILGFGLSRYKGSFFMLQVRIYWWY